MRRTKLIFGLALLSLAYLLSPIAAEPIEKENKPKKPADQFIRVTSNDDGKPLAMETAIVHFVPVDKKNNKGLSVDLVGVVHVGEEEYYEQLNKLFESYDAVLYELVAPEGTRIPKGGGKRGGGAITALQSGMQSMLELEFQLEHIDYTKDNLIHADMSPEEFAKSMKDRDESFIKMFFRMMGQSAAMEQMGKGASNTELLMAMFADDRALRLKRIMASQFQNMEGTMLALDGPKGSTIITERNKKALSVMDREIKAGKKKIAIFYGAGHLPDMQKRLIEDHGLKKKRKVTWLKAWSLEAPAKETPKEAEPAEESVKPKKKAG